MERQPLSLSKWAGRVPRHHPGGRATEQLTALEQEELAARAWRGQLVMAGQSEHGISPDQPHLAVQAVRDVLEQAGGPPRNGESRAGPLTRKLNLVLPLRAGRSRSATGGPPRVTSRPCPCPVQRQATPLVAVAALLDAALLGRGELRALLRGAVRWRLGWQPWTFAVLGPAVLLVAGLLVAQLFRQPWPPLSHVFQVKEYPHLGPLALIACDTVFYGFGEEIGWRGFALPRLISRCGRLRRSACHGRSITCRCRCATRRTRP